MYFTREKDLSVTPSITLRIMRSPGPKYMLPPSVGFNNHDVTIKRSPAFSLGPRFSNPYEKKGYTPSPIIYNTRGVLRNGPIKLPGGIVGYKLTGKRNDLIPAPSVYFPDYTKSSTYRTAPAFTLGVKRSDMGSRKVSPASNAYYIPDTVGTSVAYKKTYPSYSQLGRYEKKHGFFLPSAAQYNPVNCDVFKKKSPEYSQKGRKKDRQYRSYIIPAANSYFPNLTHKKSTPSYYFGVKGNRLIPPFELNYNDEKIEITEDDL
ncbi:ciliary microtubule associated protein 1B-like [Lycorma delicatula]|uniref:ciliary microtubule associated protein 1B-like n=1 Tax=Lycorma delicatula TaxID=130591 RepID=UPI003F5126E3